MGKMTFSWPNRKMEFKLTKSLAVQLVVAKSLLVLFLISVFTKKLIKDEGISNG